MSREVFESGRPGTSPVRPSGRTDQPTSPVAAPVGIPRPDPPEVVLRGAVPISMEQTLVARSGHVVACSCQRHYRDTVTSPRPLARRPRPGASAGTAHPLAVLGLDAATEQLYRRVLRYSGLRVHEMAALVERTPEGLEHDLTPLLAVGLVRVVRNRVTAAMPQVVLNRLISEEERRLATVGEQLEQLRSMVPQLQAEHFDSVGTSSRPVVGEVVPAIDLPGLHRALVEQGSGTLRWLRPMPADDEGPEPVPLDPSVDDAVVAAVRAGRRSQALYPARALQFAADELRARAAHGEEIRVAAEVPTRLEVLGDSGVVLDARTEDGDPARLVVRHPQITALAELAFAGLWERALPIPGLEAHRDRRARERSLLLEQLAAGAKDEQISRVLGWGLRTVRRRVAELMEELGVETRFQAGMEAVRRGWL